MSQRFWVRLINRLDIVPCSTLCLTSNIYHSPIFECDFCSSKTIFVIMDQSELSISVAAYMQKECDPFWTVYDDSALCLLWYVAVLMPQFQVYTRSKGVLFLFILCTTLSIVALFSPTYISTFATANLFGGLFSHEDSIVKWSLENLSRTFFRMWPVLQTRHLW